MNNKNISTLVGTGVIVILTLTAGTFIWVYEKGKYQNSKNSTEQVGTASVPPNNVSTDENLAVDEPIEKWKNYRDAEYGFEFKHPSNYVVKKTNGNYLISKTSMEEFIHFSVKKWKGYTIPEGTPGTFWEKIAQNNWKYFSGNNQITSGNCNDNELAHVPGSTTADQPKICVIDKQKKYIKIETESKIIYFTNNLEMVWSITPENKNVLDEITATLVIE